MPLLERETELAALSQAWDAAAAGRGGTVLVCGEAGIGKTGLVRAFTAGLDPGSHVLAGGCDDLSTPRTLGPLLDAARHAPPALRAALSGGDREVLYPELQAALDRPGHPTLLVVEDVHWADDATLDVLAYLAPRIGRLRALLVATYRDDEIDRQHPLRRVLGTFARAGALRVRLGPLSPDAVARLAAPTGLDPGPVVAATGGNAFFVTEVLAHPTTEVPGTVVDAVLARHVALPGPAREVVEQLSIIPSAAEDWLVEALGANVGAITDAERRGLLEARAGTVAFRHELARRTTEQALPQARRVELHRRVLGALRTRPGCSLGRLVHHAAQAGDVAAVLELAPQAAREAARAGAHRQAVSYYRLVLGHPAGPAGIDLGRVDLAHRASWHDEYAWALYHVGRFTDARTAAENAVRCHDGSGDPGGLGHALVTLARQQVMTNDPVAALRSAERAVGVLEPGGDSVSLALARTTFAALLALNGRPAEAIDALPLAGDLAERSARPTWRRWP